MSARHALTLAPRSLQRISAAAYLGQFFDFTHAYRFGPRAHDVTVATLYDAASGEIVSEAFHLPERSVHARDDLGMTVDVERNGSGDGWQLAIETKRFARFVHIIDPHYRAARDWFHLAPNRRCIVPLLALQPLAPNAFAAAPQKVVAPASNAAFKAGETCAAPTGEVRAINALSAIFYG
jgi:beta-mannosidase